MIELRNHPKWKEAEKIVADAKERADALRKEAEADYIAAGLVEQIGKRLVYAAYAKCPCGAGMAYDPFGESGGYKDGKRSFHGYWDCAAIIVGEADEKVKHEAQLPWAFYEIKSEGQPSANGATTRPEKWK